MQKILKYFTEKSISISRKFGIPEETRLGFISYFFNTGWMMTEKVLFMVMAFFVGIYVARYLGPEQYGLLNFAVSFAFIFQAFSKLGLGGIVVRNIVNNKDESSKILGTSFTLMLIGSFISLLLVVLALEITHTDFQTKLMVIVITAGFIFDSLEVSRYYFEAKVLAKYSSISASVAMTLSSAIKIVLILCRADLFWFAAIFTFEILIKNILYFTFYNIKIKNKTKWSFSFDYAKNLLHDSWPLLLSSAAVMLYMRIDQVMIKEMLGNKPIGLYSAAVKLSEIWYFIPVVITSSLFPAIIAAKNKGDAFYKKRLQQLFNMLVPLALIIILPITIFSDFIISFLYGQAYIDTVPILKVQVWACLFVFTGNAISQWQIIENQQKIILYRSLIGVAINISFNFLLIPEYGALGASYATLISFIFVGYFSPFMFPAMWKILKIQFKALFFVDLLIYISRKLNLSPKSKL